MSGIPQDQRSPHLQQRWVEALNVGPDEIPPYALLQIVDSTHPEGVCGRTVLSVRKPNCSNACELCVNGPKKIPVGKTGPVTLDFPAWVLVNGAGATGDNFGALVDSYLAEPDHHGLRILGDMAATEDGAVQRVDRDVRHTEWFLGVLNEVLCPETGAAEIVSLEGLDACLTVPPDSVTGSNLFHLAGEIGDWVLLKRRGNVCAPSYLIVQIEHKPTCVVHDVEDRGACLVKEELQISAMYCRLPDEACIILPFTDCEGPLGECDLGFTFTVICCGYD